MSRMEGADVDFYRNGQVLIKNGTYKEIAEYINKKVGSFDEVGVFCSGVSLIPDSKLIRSRIEKEIPNILREEVIQKEKSKIEPLLDSMEEEYDRHARILFRDVLEDVSYLSEIVNNIKKWKEVKEKCPRFSLKKINLGNDIFQWKQNANKFNAPKIRQSVQKLNNESLYDPNIIYTFNIGKLVGEYKGMAPSLSLDVEDYDYSDNDEYTIYEIYLKNDSVYPWKNPVLRLSGIVDIFAEGKRETKSLNISHQEHFKKQTPFDVVDIRDEKTNLSILRGRLESEEYFLKLNLYIPRLGPTKITELTAKATCEHSFIKKDYSAERKLI